MKKIEVAFVPWVITLVLITASVVLSGVNVYMDSSPAKFSTVCVGEEVMVVKSDKTDHFDLAYGADCK